MANLISKSVIGLLAAIVLFPTWAGASVKTYLCSVRIVEAGSQRELFSIQDREVQIDLSKATPDENGNIVNLFPVEQKEIDRVLMRNNSSFLIKAFLSEQKQGFAPEISIGLFTVNKLTKMMDSIFEGSGDIDASIRAKGFSVHRHASVDCRNKN